MTAVSTKTTASRAFSMQGYAALLRSFKSAGYAFTGFENTAADDRTVIMRHDIDFDLAQAADMAALEKAEGVRATYFFLLRTEMYNIFSQEGSARVRAVLDAGHDIGIHFDARAYDDLSGEAMRRAVHTEMEMISKWFGVEARYLSFHRPAPVLLEDTKGSLTAPYAHAYQSCYSTARFYISDSQGAWRYGHPFESDAFKAGKAMQVLVHPVWWDGAEEAVNTLDAFVNKRSERIAFETAKHCKVYRRGKFADVKD